MVTGMKLGDSNQVELAGQGVVPINIVAVAATMKKDSNNIFIQQTTQRDSVFEEDLTSYDVSPIIRKARLSHQKDIVFEHRGT